MPTTDKPKSRYEQAAIVAATDYKPYYEPDPEV